MKKIEASLIKRLMRISGQDLVSSVLELSHYSLSLSHTLGHLEFSWRTLALEQDKQRRQGEARIKQGKAGSNSYNRVHCRYQLACVFSLLDLECMGLHVFLFYHGMGLAKCDSIFSLALPFPNNFDDMGSLMRFVGDGWIGFEVERGGSLN